MPIKPYEFTKSADVIAQSQAKIEEMRMSRDPAVQKMAHTQQFLDAMFKLPEIRQAQKMEGLMEDAASMERDEGESELDFQIRQNEYIRQNAAKIDPNVSLQANERLMTLQTEKRERGRLAASDERQEKQDVMTAARFENEKKGWQREEEKYQRDLEKAETIEEQEEIERKHRNAKLAHDAKMRKWSTNMTAVVTNSRTGETQIIDVPGLNDANLTPGEQQAKMDQYLKDNNLLPEGHTADITSWEDAYGSEPTLTRRSGANITPSSFSKMQAAKKASFDYMRSSSQFMSKMAENPFAVEGGKQFTEFGKEIGSWTKVLDTLSGGMSITWSDEEEAKINYRLENSPMFAKIKEATNDAGEAQAMVMELAYKLAKTLDPGGRLSDQDVDMAIQMLTGTGDPRNLESIMRQRMLNAKEDWDMQMQMMRASADPAHMDQLDRYDEKFNEYYGLQEQALNNILGQMTTGYTLQQYQERRNSIVRELPEGATIIKAVR